MTKYDIPIGNVLRHYDVVSKHCPAPWVDDESQWIAFRKRVEEELDMTKQELLSLANTATIRPTGQPKQLAGQNRWG